jgi:glucose-6-phosphate-specific signal transduction histidine kinase
VWRPKKTTSKIIVLPVLIFASLDSRREDIRFWTEWYQALPEFSLLLITPWIKFWFVTVLPKYLKCATFKRILLAWIKFSVFFYMVFMVSPSKFTSSA